MLEPRLEIVTAPATEPLTVAEVRKHLRLDDEDGEPAPGAPTVALASPAAAGNVDDGAHRYRVTFVTADGETEGGTISDSVTVADKTVNGKVELTAIPTGGAAVTSRELYRTEAGGTDYLALATIADNSTTTYTDNIADASLGAAAPTTNTTEDPELVRAIETARREAEKRGRALITQTWRALYDSFPVVEVELPKPPLQSVDSVKYVDDDGTLQTLATSEYVVDTSGVRGRVYLAYEGEWPIHRLERNAVRIEFVAGYGDDPGDVPANFRDWMLRKAGDLYLHREGTVVGTISSRLEFVDTLVDSEAVLF
jgi:uncharacterized phiE125 gp8 family phage protein